MEAHDHAPSAHIDDTSHSHHTGRPTPTLVTDKPVVLSVQTLKDVLAVSTQTGLKKLDDVLHPDSVYPIGKNIGHTFFTGLEQSFRLPKMFQHSHDERLYYEVSLADGSPLPAWLSWDGENLVLSGKPPQPLTSPVVIKVTAVDKNNHSATAFVFLAVEEAAPAQEQPSQTEQPPQTPGEDLDLTDAGDNQSTNASAAPPALQGATGFTAQIAQSGQQALFYHAMQCIRQLHA
jgi:hypothetical protein